MIITRIPPSPTGNLHVGTARTALFNYLYAKKHNGKVLLRSEDTDKERSTKEFEENIIEGLQWLGITWDNEKIERQSQRSEIYSSYLEKLISEDKAYISKEKEVKEGGRSEVIRFRNPNKVVTFADEIREEVSFDTTELGDFIIAKSLTEPLYNFTVVVDDHEMGVTHVLRGEDGISNTPRQILIQEAIGAKRPTYAHLPLLLGHDRSKLSKRHGATSIDQYKEQGYLSNTLVNYLAFLGWNPGTDQEIFSLKELVEAFDLKQIQKGGAIFNQEKLDWFNGEYIKKMNTEERQKLILEQIQGTKLEERSDLIEKLDSILIERITTFNDIKKDVEAGEYDYLVEQPDYTSEETTWKDSGVEVAKEHLTSVLEIFSEKLSDSQEPDEIKSLVWEYASEKGRGDVLWPLRYCLSGKEKSPDPFTLVWLLGKEVTIERIKYALEKLS